MLRPDFEFYESPKARAARIDEEIRHYTESQFEALDHMRRMPRVVFDGPAGTGKTLLAIEAARRARAAGRRVLLLCFNRPLAEWLREQTAGLCDATTVSDHMVRAAGIPAGSPQLCGGTRVLGGELPRARRRRRSSTSRADYDELILDEAQDVLREQFLDVLDFSVDGGLADGFWRIFGDFRHQAIYDDSVDLDGVLRRRGQRAAPCSSWTRTAATRRRWPRWPAPAPASAAAGGRRGDGATPGACGRTTASRRRCGSTRRRAAAELLCAALEELREAGFTGPQVAVLSTRNDAACVAAAAHRAAVARPR